MCQRFSFYLTILCSLSYFLSFHLCVCLVIYGFSVSAENPATRILFHCMYEEVFFQCIPGAHICLAVVFFIFWPFYFIFHSFIYMVVCQFLWSNHSSSIYLLFVCVCVCVETNILNWSSSSGVIVIRFFFIFVTRLSFIFCIWQNNNLYMCVCVFVI